VLRDNQLVIRSVLLCLQLAPGSHGDQVGGIQLEAKHQIAGASNLPKLSKPDISLDDDVVEKPSL
jgi:hypothetical protein